MARQLSTLLHAGMPLVPALSALVEQLQSSAERPGRAAGPNGRSRRSSKRSATM